MQSTSKQSPMTTSLRAPAVNVGISSSSYAGLQMEEREEESELQGLHSKLQNETEKIVRWKMAAELSLNQKKKECEESQKTIQVLRKNLVEQQMYSEQLSQSLLREKNHRLEIEEQVARTLVLVGALKERHQTLEASVSEFGSIRETLETSQSQYKNEIENLKLKLEALSAKHHDAVRDISSKANSQATDLSLQNRTLQELLAGKDLDVKALKEEMALVEEVVRESGLRIFILEERVETVSADLVWSKAQSAKALQEANERYDNFLRSTSETEAALQEQLKEVQADLSTCKKLLDEKITAFEALLKECESKEGVIQSLTLSLEEEKANFQRLQVETTQEREIFAEALNEAQSKMSHLVEEKTKRESERDALREECATLKGSLSSAEEESRALGHKLQVIHEELSEQTRIAKEILESKEKLQAEMECLAKEKEQLGEDVEEERRGREKASKDLHSSKKSLEFELKKSDKLRLRIQTLESKLKEVECSTEADLKLLRNANEDFEFKVLELQTKNLELSSSLEALKEKSEASEETLRSQIQELQVAKDAAEVKAQEAETNMKVKVKDVMDLAESWKRDSEVTIEERTKEAESFKKELEETQKALSQTQDSLNEVEADRKEMQKTRKEMQKTIDSQDDEILTLRDKLTQQINEFRELQASIKSVNEDPIPKEGIIKNSLKGVFTSKSKKNVSFLSSVLEKMDSDSSDGFTIEIGSDSDDRFEAIKRSSQVRRPTTQLKQGIPKANIQPIPRLPLTPFKSQQQQQSVRIARTPSVKRSRVERSYVKTYTSPKHNRKSNSENDTEFLIPKSKCSRRNEKVSLPFESVFDFNEQADK